MAEELNSFQHFGFTATQVTLERNFYLKSLLHRGFESLIQKSTSNPDTANLLKRKSDEIVENLLKSAQVELDELAALDRRVFKIPNDMIIGKDHVFKDIKNYTAEKEKAIDEEIDILTREFLENSIMIASMEQQEDEFEMMKPFLQQHFITRDKTKTAIELLNKNKLCHVQNLIQATKQVADQLKSDGNDD